METKTQTPPFYWFLLSVEILSHQCDYCGQFRLNSFYKPCYFCAICCDKLLLFLSGSFYESYALLRVTLPCNSSSIFQATRHNNLTSVLDQTLNRVVPLWYHAAYGPGARESSQRLHFIDYSISSRINN